MQGVAAKNDASYMIIEGREYSLLRGSDVDLDGMYLELYEAPNGSFSFTLYVEEIPDAALAWFRKEAERLLPPIDRTV